MIDPGIDNKLIELFFEDTNEMLKESINQIIDIERDYNEKKIEDIMRNMHSIKGSSGMLELKTIENFSHNLETIFVKLKKKEININSELIDFLINSINMLKEKIDIRYSLFLKNGETFNQEIEQEKMETEEIMKKIDEICEEEINKSDNKKNIYKIEIYLNKYFEMLEAKRLYIEKALGSNGKIMNLISSKGNFAEEEKNHYKIIYETDRSKKEVIELLNTTNINFIAIAEFEKSEEENLKFEIYIQRDINLENINEIYEELLKIYETSKIKKVDIKNLKIDVYGIQLLESLKKGGVSIEGKY